MRKTELGRARRVLAQVVVVAAFAAVLPGVGHATTIVGSGWDLFETAAPAPFDFATVPNPQTVLFEGSPLGCFDFGAGCVGTDATDTIVRRLGFADLAGGNDTIDIEIVALSLSSIDPVDLGFGAGFEDLFVTLNTSSPSLQSQMTIFDTGEGTPHGTFDSTLNFSFDVTGSVGGFYGTIEQTFNSAGTPWTHDHQPSAFLIAGVNHNLNAIDHGEDFHLAPGAVLHTGPHPVVGTGTLPEPSTGLLLGLALLGVAFTGRR